MCAFDFIIEYSEKPNGGLENAGNSSHTVTIRNAASSESPILPSRYSRYQDMITNECLPKNVAIKIMLDSKESLLDMLRSKTPLFTLVVGAVLVLNMLVGKQEVEKYEFIHNNRIENL